MANVLRLILFAIPFVIPLLTLQWSVLDLFGLGTPGADGLIHFHPAWLGLHIFDGHTKPQVEWKVAALLSMMAYGLTVATEGTRLYLPRKRFDDFRTEYLNERRKEWTAQAGSEIR